jgi:hypothetical protein
MSYTDKKKLDEWHLLRIWGTKSLRSEFPRHLSTTFGTEQMEK